MKNLQRIICFLLLFTLLTSETCEESHKEVLPSSIILYNHLRPALNEIKYEIKNNDSIIIYKRIKSNTTDIEFDAIYSTAINSKIGTDVLSFDNITYENPCIQDGELFTLSIRTEKETKEISFQNYPNENLAKIISFINNNIPERYQIYYNMERLKLQLKNCN